MTLKQKIDDVIKDIKCFNTSTAVSYGFYDKNDSE